MVEHADSSLNPYENPDIRSGGNSIDSVKAALARKRAKREALIGATPPKPVVSDLHAAIRAKLQTPTPANPVVEPIHTTIERREQGENGFVYKDLHNTRKPGDNLVNLHPISYEYTGIFEGAETVMATRINQIQTGSHTVYEDLEQTSMTRTELENSVKTKYTGVHEKAEEVYSELKKMEELIIKPEIPEHIPARKQTHTFILPDKTKIELRGDFLPHLLEYILRNQKAQPKTLEEITYDLYRHYDNFPTKEQLGTHEGQVNFRWWTKQLTNDINSLNKKFRTQKPPLDWMYKNVEPKFREMYNRKIRAIPKYALIQPEKVRRKQELEVKKKEAEEQRRAQLALISDNRLGPLRVVITSGSRSLISPQDLVRALLPEQKGTISPAHLEELVDQTYVTVKAFVDLRKVHTGLAGDQAKFQYALGRSFPDVSPDDLPQAVGEYVRNWLIPKEVGSHPQKEVGHLPKDGFRVGTKENQAFMRNALKITKKIITPQQQSWVTGNLGKHGVDSAAIQEAETIGLINPQEQTQTIVPSDLVCLLFWIQTGKPNLSKENIDQIKTFLEQERVNYINDLELRKEQLLRHPQFRGRK